MVLILGISQMPQDKFDYYDSAMSTFQDSCVCISMDGKRHLGAALGSPSFITFFVS